MAEKLYPKRVDVEVAAFQTFSEKYATLRRQLAIAKDQEEAARIRQELQNLASTNLEYYVRCSALYSL